MRILTILAIAFLLTSCSSDPSDPGSESNGDMQGTVVLCNEHLVQLTDMSGVTVRLVDQDGKRFEAITSATGEWSISAPLGTYQIDTIAKDGYQLLSYGHSGVLNGLKNKFSWIGKGAQMILQESVLCPPVLDSVLVLGELQFQIDTTSEPVDGHYPDGPRNHYSDLHFSCASTIVGPANTGQTLPEANVRLATSGQDIMLRGSERILASTYSVEGNTGRIAMQSGSFSGATVTLSVNTKVLRRRYVETEPESWKVITDTLPTRSSTVTGIVP